jgi:uncharacterized protein with HEPN domain
MPKRDENLRLYDVWHAASRVLEYAAGVEKEELRTSPMRLDAILRNLEIIGEASKHLSPETQARYPAIDWANARAMRNVITHGYDAVSFEIVWQTLQDDIKPLEAALHEDAKKFEKDANREGQS